MTSTQDPNQRPSAADLLQHQWIYENRRTLKRSWTNGKQFLTGGGRPRPAGVDGGDAGGQPSQAAHESISSVVNRMLAAEEEEDDYDAPRQSDQQQQQQSATPSPSLPGLPAAAAAYGGAVAGSMPLPPLPAAGSPSAASQQQQQRLVAATQTSYHLAAGGMHSPTTHQPPGGTYRAAPQLGDMISSLQGHGMQNGGTQQQQQGQVLYGLRQREAMGSPPTWLDERQVGVYMAARRQTADDSEQAREDRLRVMELVKALRPAPGGAGREAPHPGMQPGGAAQQHPHPPAAAASVPQSRACAQLAELLLTSPDAKAAFLGENGVLLLLEMLDTDDAKAGSSFATVV